MIQYLPFVWAVIGSIGHIGYIRSIYLWSTKPNKVTWFFWALAPLIAFFASISNGFHWSTLPVFMIGFGPLVIFTVSCFYKKAFWKLGALDYICGGFSLLALLLWRYTKEPNIAIVFAIVSDGLAAIPTIIKVWRHPETESTIVYLTAFLAMSTSLLTVETWSFNQAAFPIYIMFVDITVILLILRRKFWNTKKL